MKAVLSATATSSVGDDLAEHGRHLRIAGRQRLRHRADGEARLQAGKIGELGHEGAVDKHDAAAFDRGEHRARVLGARLGGGVGVLASGLASRISARRSVYFHSSTRRCGRPAVSKRLKACSRNAATAPAPGSAGLDGSEIRRQPGLGRSLDRSDLGVHDRLTPPLPGIARSRWPRARAPAPCRRCARCGRARARAPRPARCS